MHDHHKFKVLIVGDGGVGKSSFVKRHLTGDFERKYIATMGVEVTPLSFNTNKGLVTFNMWDCAGQDKFKGFGNYYEGADFAIVMFDVTSRNSYANCKEWIAKLPAGLPIVLCGNKVDCVDRVVKPKDGYIDLSVKSNFNHRAPFHYIMQALMGEVVEFA
jgi:GTP-binding nuclear protein Ran